MRTSTLFSMGKIKLGVAAALLGAFGLVLAPQVNATPITFYNDAGTLNTERFTLGCGGPTGDCTNLLEALVSESPTAYDSTNPRIGDLFSLTNSGIATETAFVNAHVAGAELFLTGTQNNMGGVSSGSFATSADYFLIKIGRKPNYALVHNLHGNLNLYFTQTGQGAGFSHFTAFGTAAPTAVPEPSSLGLLGLGLLVLSLLVGVRRRGTRA